MVVVVLLLASYVASDGLAWWLEGRGIISENDGARVSLTIHRPLVWNRRDSGLPGANALRDFEYWCFDEGEIARERSME